MRDEYVSAPGHSHALYQAEELQVKYSLGHGNNRQRF
jgi:hypothetical protein